MRKTVSNKLLDWLIAALVVCALVYIGAVLDRPL